MPNSADTPAAVLRRLLAYLLPEGAEQDAGFRHELARLTGISLLVTGGVQISLSLFMLASRFLIDGESSTLALRSTQGIAIILCGIATIACSRIPRLESWWRAIAILSGLATGSVLIWASLLAKSQTSNPDDFIPGQITLVMLLAVTVVPLKPAQTFGLGAALCGIYVTATLVLAWRAGEAYVPDGSYLLFIVMLTLLCTVITAVVYRQRQANYELRQIQARALLAENATSVARLAAALSHELNNPMGALLSGIDTLLLLTSRQATCGTVQEQTRLVILQADVRKSIQQSAGRLKKLVARMQRFTNLDQAEVQNVDLNELLTDVAALLEPQLPPATKLELDLQPLEAVVCRPQQISAVFSNLLTNAAQAVNGEGGRIVVSTRQRAREIEIEFRDNGHGVDKKHLDDIFEPSLEAKGSRVRSGNWSMFTSRQIIREHGGEIRIDSGQGKGTTVWVTLPLSAEALT